jgi:hypothetical protein
MYDFVPHSGVLMADDPESKDGKRWRERAEECRSATDGIRDEASRRQMIGVAESYERMAVLADKRANTARNRAPHAG